METMSWKEQPSDLPREFLRLNAVVGTFNLLLGAFVAWSFLPLTDRQAFWGVGFGCALALLGLGGFYVAFKQRRSAVAINRHGLATNESPSIPWGKIQSVREHRILQRAELVGVDGDVLAKLDYRLDRIDFLIAEVLEKVSVRSGPSKRLFHSKTGYIPIGLALIFLAGLCYALVSSGQQPILAWVMIAVFVGALISMLRSLLFSLEITPGGLVLRRLLRTEIVKYRAIRNLELFIKREARGGRRAVVLITLRDGGQVSVCPYGCDPYDVFQRLNPLIERR